MKRLAAFRHRWTGVVMEIFDDHILVYRPGAGNEGNIKPLPNETVARHYVETYAGAVAWERIEVEKKEQKASPAARVMAPRLTI